MDRFGSSRAASGVSLEGLESRRLFSGEIDHAFAGDGLLTVQTAGGGNLGSGEIAVQPDGKIVVAGPLASNGNTAVVRRYLANGNPDTGFGTNGVKTIANVKAYTIDRVTVLADGRIQITGQQSVRLTAGGQIDGSFGGGDGVAPSLLATDRRASDFVYADGSYLELSIGLTLSGGNNRVFKYKADGSPDKAWGSNGSVPVTYPDILGTDGLAVDSAGQIHVSFEAQNPDIDGLWDSHVLRLNAAGTLDGTWGTAGVATNEANQFSLTNNLTVLSDGRVAVNARVQSEGASSGFFIVFSKDGKSNVVKSPDHPGSFYPAELRQTASGNLVIGGYYYDNDGITDYGRQYAGVIYADSNFNTKTSFTPDQDGLAGYRRNASNDTVFKGLALTPSGDILLLGTSDIDDVFYDGPQTDVVRLEGPSKFNKVSTSFSNGVLTLNGSGQADHFLVDTTDPGEASLPDSTVAYLDYTAPFHSADIVAIGHETLVKRVTMNMNGGNDWAEATFDFNLPVSVTGGDGNDVIFGSNVGSTLRGGNGNDSIYGGSGVDWIYGDAGTDELSYGFDDHVFP
ncbi:MAG: hypothetical protein QM754_04965 [Tepidisphaeraceae bacterium]